MEALDYSIDFSTIIRAINVTAGLVLVLALLPLVQVSWLRIARRARERHERHFLFVWAAVFGDPRRDVDTLPAVGARDLTALMALWNDAHDALPQGAAESAAARTQLDRIATRYHLERAALARTRRGDADSRLTAIATLGHLRAARAEHELELLAEDAHPAISLAAARALVQVNHAAARHVVELMTTRPDWPPARLADVVQQEAVILEPALIDAIGAGTDAVARLLLPHLRFCSPAAARPVVDWWLRKSSDPSTLRAALRALAEVGTSADADLAAGFLEHENWRVRVRALNAVAKLGGTPHVHTLATLLHDDNWWVRYRAAQALSKLGGGSALERLLKSESDYPARAVIAYVIAERTSLEGSTAS